MTDTETTALLRKNDALWLTWGFIMYEHLLLDEQVSTLLSNALPDPLSLAILSCVTFYSHSQDASAFQR